MNVLKRIFCAVLAAAAALSLCACHGKDETAITAGDVKITSALYMCALMNADSEARTKVDEAASSSSSSETASTVTDYYSEKIDDKDYTTWVKDEAIKTCLRYAAIEILCKENKIELSEDELSEFEQYADYYWNSLGYSSLYGENGVSFETFKRSLKSSYLSNAYFESLYGEGGSKAVAAADVTKALSENFVIADVLSESTADMEDAAKTELKTKLSGYVDRLNKGATFEEIYKEHYSIEDTDETDSSTDAEDDTPAPKDQYARALGSEDTDYADDNYATVRDMKIGEAKLVETDDAITVLVKGDMMGDPYWVDRLTSATLYLLKGDEFDKDLDDYCDKLDYKKNNYAINRFKVKKIVYPTGA